MPAWMAVLGWLAFRDRLPWIVVVGIVVGLVGVAILAWPVGGPTGALDPLGVAALLVAPAGWSTGSLYAARRAHLPRPALLATTLQLILGGLGLGVFALVTGEPARFDPAAVSGRSLLAVAYLVTFGSLIAYSAYAWLLAHAPISKVATYAYVNPVVAVILGAIVLGEAITARTIVAGVVIVVAVALIVSARIRVRRPVDRPRPAAVAVEPSSEAA
jgi:drug/metabolite transporter (DMT)-like permease